MSVEGRGHAPKPESRPNPTLFPQKRNGSMHFPEIKSAALSEMFRWHAPSDKQRAGMERVRKAAQAFAEAIVETVPNCSDQRAALRKTREAMMVADFAIVTGGRF
jgi:hypothetical protein